MEEYLQSARQTRLVHQPSFNNKDLVSPGGHAHLGGGEESVFNEGELGVPLSELSVQPPRSRRPLYQPCTIPQQRDRTRVQGEEGEEGEGEGEEEEKPGLKLSGEVREEMSVLFYVCETCMYM